MEEATTHVSYLISCLLCEEHFDEVILHYQALCTQPFQPFCLQSTSAQFATSNLFLKLDVAHVAATWNRISGNMRSIFSLPREQVVAAAACIPETSSMISAPQVYAKNNGIKDAVHASRDVLETTKMIPHKVLGSQPRPASKKANRKRPKSGKSTDKRPVSNDSLILPLIDRKTAPNQCK